MAFNQTRPASREMDVKDLNSTSDSGENQGAKSCISCRELQNEVERAREQSETCKLECDKIVNEVTQKLAQAEHDLGKGETKQSKLQLKNSVLEQEKSELAAENASLTSELARTRKELKAQIDQVRALTDQMEALSSQLNARDAELQAAQAAEARNRGLEREPAAPNQVKQEAPQQGSRGAGNPTSTLDRLIETAIAYPILVLPGGTRSAAVSRPRLETKATDEASSPESAQLSSPPSNEVARSPSDPGPASNPRNVDSNAAAPANPQEASRVMTSSPETEPSTPQSMSRLGDEEQTTLPVAQPTQAAIQARRSLPVGRIEAKRPSTVSTQPISLVDDGLNSAKLIEGPTPLPQSQASRNLHYDRKDQWTQTEEQLAAENSIVPSTPETKAQTNTSTTVVTESKHEAQPQVAGQAEQTDRKDENKSQEKKTESKRAPPPARSKQQEQPKSSAKDDVNNESKKPHSSASAPSSSLGVSPDPSMSVVEWQLLTHFRLLALTLISKGREWPVDFCGTHATKLWDKFKDQRRDWQDYTIYADWLDKKMPARWLPKLSWW